MPPTYIPPTDKTDTQHEGIEDLAFNNTFTNRFLTLLALKTTARLYSRDGPCIPISNHKIVKTGPWVNLVEAATMRFVAENTSLPVPQVYCSFVRKNRTYIVMERIQGEEIPKVWGRLSEESRQKIFTHLRHMFQELRALNPLKGTGVENCFGGSLCDSRIPRSLPRFGPFKTIQEFHYWLRDHLQLSEIPNRENDQDMQDIKEMITKQDRPWPPPVFTHGDLNPFNILIRGDDVVGIIDWEFSGWYRHYWEYTSAWHGNLTRTEWRDQLSKFLDPYPVELEMERIRQKWWGEI